MNIEDIPDYPALQQLSRALWREGTVRGAALLVGAGFSKNAERPAEDTPSPPLWTDLAESMAKHLYPFSKTRLQSDPLRLAEEYKAYFGRAALDELIRTHIFDSAWQPGALHRELLGLEWSDILTTNWDTLLERTSETISSRAYEIVRSESDLAHTCSPRIVKLHGSINASEHFILTEEDYRTYPTSFAAFVNFARQIFIENELCLVGFSGDDPNFLQWSGWVRDNLGGNTRRIYLVGLLDMAPPKRKLLESRNVAPIDLSLLVSDLPEHCRQESAMRTFIQFLSKSKPKPLHDWHPSSLAQYDFLPKTADEFKRLREPMYKASIFDRAANIWAQDRKSYPGWLVCPFLIRKEIDIATNICSPSKAALDTLMPGRKAEILYEIAWRKDISFATIDKELVLQLLNIAYPNQTDHLTQKQTVEIAVFLLKTARRSNDELTFETLIQALAKQAEEGTDLHAELAFQRALKALRNMDFCSVKAETEVMLGPDPIWLLRRAALLVEVGDTDTAAKLVIDAQMELEKRQRQDQTSLWVKSRRAWAEWIGRATRLNRDFSFRESRWPPDFKRVNCDPGEEIDRLTNIFASDLREIQEEQFSSIPPFQAGYYIVSSKGSSKRTKSKPEHLVTLNHLMETVGLPMRLPHVSLVTKAARDAAQMSFDGSEQWYIWVLRAIDTPWGDLFQRYFSRIEIAYLSIKAVYTLSDRVKIAISYWSNRMDSHPNDRTNAYAKLRLLLEVLSRLTVRQNPGVARSHLTLTERIAQKPWADHHLLNQSLNNLLENSIKSLPPAGQEDIVKSLLSFPMSKEPNNFAQFWPEPTEYLWNVRVNRTEAREWNSLISGLIEAAAPTSNQRPAAIIRLSYLFRKKALSVIEAQSFGEVLWSMTDSGSGLPSNTIMQDYMFAELPAPNNVDKYRLVSDHLFNTDINEIFSVPATFDSRDINAKIDHLKGMGSAVLGLVQPTREQAAKLFDAIVKWRMPDLTGSDSFKTDFLTTLYGKAGHLLGDIIMVVSDALDPEDTTSERAVAILDFMSGVDASTALGALPYFVSDSEVLNTEIIRFIRQGIVGRTPEEVAGATRAVELWASDRFQAQGKSLPPQLIDQIVTAIEAGREIGILSILTCVLKLLESGLLGEGDKSRLAYALGEAHTEYQYQKIDPESRKAIIVSLVRAECLKIASALKEIGCVQPSVIAWLTEAHSDPLPEVRFALEHKALHNS